MPKTTQITLDGVEYTVPRFNIGQLERVAEAGNNAWAVLRIAMERANPPPIGGIVNLEPTMDEVTAAFKDLLELAGLKQPETPANPTQATDGAGAVH